MHKQFIDDYHLTLYSYQLTSHIIIFSSFIFLVNLFNFYSFLVYSLHISLHIKLFVYLCSSHHHHFSFPFVFFSSSSSWLVLLSFRKTKQIASVLLLAQSELAFLRCNPFFPVQLSCVSFCYHIKRSSYSPPHTQQTTFMMIDNIMCRYIHKYILYNKKRHAI